MFQSPFARFRSVAAVSALGLALALGFVAAPLPAEEELPLQFDANAVNMSNVGPRGQVRLQVRVNRWSTDEERAKLMEALKDQSRGSRELANTLFGKESVGSIRESQSLAYDLRYARSLPTEGGRQIILATDRRIAFAEAWRSARTLDYNVSLIILDVDDEGRGEGQLMLGAEFTWNEDKNQVEITHFASEPIRLNNVRLR
ncbi:MAG: hypothetical protein WBO53_17980 [Thermoanaerobaculia bacterium]|jgi:hypothetical protein